MKVHGNRRMKMHVRKVEEQKLWKDWKETNGIQGKWRALQWGLEIERPRESRQFSPALGDEGYVS